MKKLLLLSWCILALALTGRAASFSVTTANLLQENGKSTSRDVTFDNLPKPLTYSGFEFLFEKGSASAGPRWASRNGGYLSFTNGATLKVSLPTEGVITSIKATFRSGNGGDMAASTGATTYDDATLTTTWTGSASEVTFTNNVIGKALYILSFEVEYSADLPVSDAPTFNPPAGTYPNEIMVSIEAVAGAKIYYTTDGSKPSESSQQFTAPFKLERTTTVKAIAVEDGKDPSSAATAEYKVIPGIECNNIRLYLNSTSNLIGPVPNTLYTIKGDVTVTFQSGNVLYVQDTSGALSIRGNLGRTYQPGDVISDFSGTPYVAMNDESDRYLSPIAGSFGAPKSHTDFVFPEATFDDLRNDFNLSRAYLLKNVYMSRSTDAETAENFGYAVFADGSSELLYNTFTGFPLKEGWYDIEGIMAKQTTESVTWMFYPTMYNQPSGAQTEAPVLSLATGTYYDAQTLTITAPQGAKIYYTTDGSTPYPGSTRYEAPVTIEESCLVKAIAVVPGQQGSTIAEAEYTMTLLPKAEAPVLLPAESDEAFVGQVTVTITAAEGLSVYYTTDGTEPTENSTAYSEPFELTHSATVKAIATADGMRNSNVAEATYVVKAEAPAFTPAAGEYAEKVDVTIEAAEGMTIAYTIDGTEPTKDSTVYTAPVTITTDTTVKAIAFAENVEPSDVAVAAYVIDNSGINTVAVEGIDTDATYYDINGRRIANPSAGNIYIKVAAGEATRVLVK